MFTALILEFIFFSFLGWVIDSAYRNIGTGEIYLAPLFTGPFALVYGLAILIASGILKLTRAWNAFWRITTLSLAMILLEYASAAFCDKVLGFKLWNYANSPFNLHGYIDLIHSVEWMVAMVFFYYLVFPVLEKFERLVAKHVRKTIDVTLLIVFLVFLGLFSLQRTLYWRTIYPEKVSDDVPCAYCTPLSSIFK